MPAKRKSQNNSNSSSKKAKVEAPNCFQFIGANMTKEISSYLSLGDLSRFKLACKETNSAVKMPKPIRISKWNFEHACKTPGYHFIKLEGQDTTLQRHINDCGGSKEMTFIAVTDLVIDFCGNKENDQFARKTIGTLFPKLKSLKLIRCAHDVEILIPQCMTNLTTLEIYTSGSIKVFGDQEIENARLCSTQKYIEGNNNIELLPWNTYNMEHGKNYKYYGKKICVNMFVNIFQQGCAIFGPRADFVPNQKFLTQ